MDAKLARAELVFRQSAEPFQHSYTYVDMFELHLNMFEHVTSNMRTTLLGLLCHVKDRRYFTKPNGRLVAFAHPAHRVVSWVHNSCRRVRG